MAELRDRDEAQARADRAEDDATALAADPEPERVHDTLVMEGVFEGKAAGEEALVDRQDGRSVEDLDRALDEWSRELGDRGRGDDLEGRAHQVHDEAVAEQARAVAEVVEEGFPVLAEVDHAKHVGKAGAKAQGGRAGERSRARTRTGAADPRTAGTARRRGGGAYGGGCPVRPC